MFFMAIVENDLIDLIIRLNGLESQFTQSLSKTVKVKKELQKILKLGEKLPIDSRTGMTISDATRQEIYDACSVIGEDLLNPDT